MNLSNIKAVFFDAADTLFFIKQGLGNTYAEPAKKYGINPDPQDLKKAFSIHFQAAPPLAFANVCPPIRMMNQICLGIPAPESHR